MKKVIYLLTALIISGGSVFGNSIYHGQNKSIHHKVNPAKTNQFNIDNVLKGPKVSNFVETKSQNRLLNVGDNRYTNLVTSLGNSSFNWNYERDMASPISYDPTLGDNGMVAVMNMEPDYRIPRLDGGGGPSRLTLSMYYSLDGGMNWTSRDSIGYYDTETNYYTSPTLGIVNTNQSQVAGGLTSGVKETFDFVIYSRKYLVDGGTYNGMGLYVNLELYPDAYVADLKGPSVNESPDGQMWGFAAATSSNAVGNSGVYFVSLLSPDPFDQYQYGYYGSIGINTSDEGNFTGDNVPPQFWADKFRPSDGGLGSSFQNKPLISNDSKGNIYVASNNMLVDDIDVRSPVVWKSTDGGTTWSEPNKCPKTVMDEVGNNLVDGSEGYQEINYSQEAFIAYGEDKYSYIMRLRPYANDRYIGISIVEFSYDNGVWTGRKVADIAESMTNKYAIPTWLSYNSRIGERFGFSDSLQLPLMEEENTRGHELEAAITADGNSLVVKYLDWDGSRTVTFKNPESGNDSTYIYFREGTNEFGLEDTVAVEASYDIPNDLFVVSRDISDDAWGEEYNTTNDEWNYRNTFMPKIVPSKTNIPIALGNSVVVTNPNFNAYPMRKMPLSLWSQVSWWWFQNIDVLSLDGTRNAEEGPSPWDPDYVQSVKNTVNNDFKLFEPYPNPSRDGSVEIMFNLNHPGYVTVTISDAMGRTIATPLQGQYGSGNKGFTFNTSQIANGTYFINVTMGNNTATKILNIVN